VLPPSRGGVTGAVIPGLGRALGETMAVVMVIGGGTDISRSILAPGSTIASHIASNFAEAPGPEIEALIALGLMLFAVTLLVNIAGRLIVRRGRKATA